jgi:hypothetical protein
MQALQAAETVGIPLPDGAISHAEGYIAKALEKYEKQAEPNRSRLEEIAGALACNFELILLSRRGTKVEFPDKWLQYCQNTVPVGRAIVLGRDELIHFYYAQALFSRGDDAWKHYRTATFDYLKSRQNKDGSWPAANGICVGQVYATAIWCIVFQVDKDNHPTMRRAA